MGRIASGFSDFLGDPKIKSGGIRHQKGESSISFIFGGFYFETDFHEKKYTITVKKGDYKIQNDFKFRYVSDAEIDYNEIFLNCCGLARKILTDSK
jgi:hypothetical protein